ncbi:hypothetical protein DVH05_010795 [Phytophthora capsici]|nr:hypothetical protein DVH05_010795 [Phytophthora capsici]
MNQGLPDPHAPDSQPTRQGRRLIRMLFRSSAENAKSPNEPTEQDCRNEDAVLWKQPVDAQTSKDNDAPVPEITSRFATLKRKLFPSQNRRHPRRVPPLITCSPVNTPAKFSLPPLGENLKPVSCSSSPTHDEREEQHQNNFEPRCKDEVDLTFSGAGSQELTPKSDFSTENNNWGTTGERALIDDDDDRDLESAVEALDLESSIADKTLEEMSKAIADLRAWKETQQQEIQQALNMLEQERMLTTDLPQEPIECAEPLTLQLEFKIQNQQRNRETQVLEFRKESEAYQLECALKTELDEFEATRVEEVLNNSSNCEDSALSRLRDDLFQLDVKQRQENLLQELKEAETELDINAIDTQAFTNELDAILAQFNC